jgi:enoyl-CoA hydratase
VWKTVDVARHGPVIVVTICRPERRNAVDAATASALLDVFSAFDDDNGASAAVLTGAGGTFCAGADLKALASGEPRPVHEVGPGPMGPTRLELSKPVIAAIEGHAVAGGLELALWCDLRVASADATLGVYCRRFGVPLVDGGTVRLPRLVGQSHALDLILTGRGVRGPEALAMGLVNRVVPPGSALDEAVALALELAALPQTCLRNDRRSVLWQWGHTELGALRTEARLGQATIQSGETLEGASRFLSGAGRHGDVVDPAMGAVSDMAADTATDTTAEGAVDTATDAAMGAATGIGNGGWAQQSADQPSADKPAASPAVKSPIQAAPDEEVVAP